MNKLYVYLITLVHVPVPHVWEVVEGCRRALGKGFVMLTYSFETGFLTEFEAGLGPDSTDWWASFFCPHSARVTVCVWRCPALPMDAQMWTQVLKLIEQVPLRSDLSSPRHFKDLFLIIWTCVGGYMSTGACGVQNWGSEPLDLEFQTVLGTGNRTQVICKSSIQS